jgi:PAS domain-containing protein
VPFDEPAARGPRPTGQYRLDLATQTWWWSDGIYALHGFAPGEVVPTTELVLSHHHPTDRDRLARFLARARPSEEPFGALHRLVDADGQERSVAVVGRVEPAAGDAQDAVTLHGYATDVSEPVRQRASAVATRQIEESSRSRGTIERAKGALAAIYRIAPDAAFELLRTASNRRNTPLREIAAAAVDLSTAADTGRRARLDTLLGRVSGTPRPPRRPGTPSTSVVTG